MKVTRLELKSIIKECIEEVLVIKELNTINEATYKIQKVGDKYAIVNSKTNYVTKYTFADKKNAIKFAKEYSGKTLAINPKRKVKQIGSRLKDIPAKVRNKGKQFRADNLHISTPRKLTIDI